MTLALLMLVLLACAAVPAAAVLVGRWEAYEVTLTAQAHLGNPYVEGLPEGGKPYLLATFTGVSGDAKGIAYTVPGFWYGGQTWKLRFAPPATGEWWYVSTSPDRGLDGVTGTLQCRAWSEAELVANPARHGFVRVHTQGERAGRYFEYADGTPFLWIGDTWWRWAKPGASFPRAKQVIDDRSARGFSVGHLFFGNEHARRLVGAGCSSPDLEAIHGAERFIAYANSKGITLWTMPWWSWEDLSGIGAEKMRRWSRYVVHRLAAFNVIWSVGAEYNGWGYGGMGLQFWKDLGALMRAEDPYYHAIGIQNTVPTTEYGWMDNSAQWSTGEVLHHEPWLDFNTGQTGHGKWKNELAPAIVAADYARRPPKPTLLAEPWYEFVEGAAPAMDIRFAAWSAILSGAAGHAYGGGHQWRADVPEPSLSGWHSVWPGPPGTVDTLDYPGAVSIAFMAQFLRGIEWWKLEPHPELVLEYAQPLAAAIPDQEYVVYARYGGKLKLDLRAASGEFEYIWIDLTTSQEIARGAVEGGAIRFFLAPECAGAGRPEYRDCVLHVRRGR